MKKHFEGLAALMLVLAGAGVAHARGDGQAAGAATSRCEDLSTRTEALAACIVGLLGDEAGHEGRNPSAITRIAISPDGRWLTYRTDNAGRPGGDHWLLDLSGASPPRPRALPSWSLWTGESRLFLQGRVYDPARHAWPERMDVSAWTAWPPFSPRWSRSGRYLAYLRAGSTAPAMERRRQSATAPLPFSDRGNVYDPAPRENIYHVDVPMTLEVYDRDTGRTRQPLPAGMLAKSFSISPDETTLVVEVDDPADVNRYGNVRTRLVLVDIATGTVTALPSLPGSDEFQPAWSPDGNRIAFFVNDAEEARYSTWPNPDSGRIAVIDRAGARVAWSARMPAAVTTGTLFWSDVDGIIWSTDGRSLSFGKFDRAFSPARLRFDVGTGRFDWLALAGGDETPRNWSEVAFSRSGGWMAYLEERPTRQKALYVTRADKNGVPVGEPRLVLEGDASFEGEIDSRVVHWASPDRRFQLSGLLLLPRASNANGPPPMIVSIPGGPNAFEAAFGGTHWGTELALALRGYAVFIPSSRGRLGGSDAELARGIAETGSRYALPFADVNAGVDMLVARGLADPRRLGMFGHSYGGGFVAYATTQTNRFRAVVDHEGIGANLLDNDQFPAALATDQSTNAIVMRYMFGIRSVDRETARRLIDETPLFNADHIETPSLFIFGNSGRDEFYTKRDGRLMLYALRRRGVPSMLLEYAMGHVPANNAQATDHIVWTIDWLDYWLLGRPSQNPERQAAILASRQPVPGPPATTATSSR